MIKGGIFLTGLVTELRSQYPQWRLSDHCKVEWKGQPKSHWPEADIFVDTPTRQFIIEYDDDSDPGRSLIKYWPVLQASGDKTPFTIIEVWRRGSTIGGGYAGLAKWIGARLMELYPPFVYEFIERRDESAKAIAEKLATILEFC